MGRLEVTRYLLKYIEKTKPYLYRRIEGCTEYPNNEDFDIEDEYDMAVDVAEIKALITILEEEVMPNADK